MIAFITGATSGFGRAIAFKFAEHGWDLILCGRREDRLREIEENITATFGNKVYSFSLDVRNRQQVTEKLNAFPNVWKAIDVLVNNAGLAAGLDAIHEADLDDWEDMIDTNIKGLLYVSRTVIPWMIDRGHGHVINIGSTASREAYPKGSVYCATKFAVDAISKGMRIDLLSHGIKVTAVHPGAVETEFSIVRFKGDAERAGKVYQGFEPLSAEDVADVVWFAASRPKNVVLNDIVMTPLAQAGSAYIHRKS